MSILKKIRTSLLYVFFLGVATLFLLELSYRFYIIDFYRGNLTGLNPIELLEKTDQSTILIIGDSFTADPDSYVAHLRKKLSNHRVINAAIPGTCVKQHSLFFKKRIQEFKPDILIYQIYVGNDLLEFRHPLKSPNISWARKIYWWLSDRIIVLTYINAKLPVLRQAIYHDLPIKTDPKALETFSMEGYSARSKLQFRAEPNLLEHTISLQGERKQDMFKFTKTVNQILQQAPSDCEVYVLVMPHCIQINERYISRLQSIGATISRHSDNLIIEYPFIKYLKQHLDSTIHLINPLEHLKKQELVAPVYYGNDPHLNSYGQKVVGDVIMDSWQ